MQNSITKYVSFRENGKVGLVDSTGEIIVNAIYDSIQPFFGDFAKVQIDGKFGLINKRGKLITGKYYNRIDIRYWGNDDQNIYIIHCGNKKGFYLDGSEEFSGFRYNSIGTLHNDRALISIKGLYGYINGKGEIAIPPQFTHATNYDGNIAVACVDYKTSYIDLYGNLIPNPQSEFVLKTLSELTDDYYYRKNSEAIYNACRIRNLERSDFSNEIAWQLYNELKPCSLKLGSLKGYVMLFNDEKVLVSPVVCTQIKMTAYNRFIATTEDEGTVCDAVWSTDRVVVLAPVFDEIIHLQDDIYIVRLKNHYGLVDERGKFIGKCNYKYPHDIPEILQIIQL